MIVVGEWKGLLGKGLAPRELECVLGLASGLTHKQIARDMSIAPMTVTKRVSSAMFKLGVQRAPQLVAEAMKRQIISPLCVAMMTLVMAHAFLDEDPMRRDRRAGAPHRPGPDGAARRDDGDHGMTLLATSLDWTWLSR